MKITAVIPARFGSSRLEGKPLKDIWGKPMIQHVYERVLQAKNVERAIVATDDERIVEAVEKFGGIARMTSIDHQSGTDRVAEVMSNEKASIVINVQGDEPLIDPRLIDEASQPLIDDDSLVAATLCKPILQEEKLSNPNVVKVIRDYQDFGIYFSRSVIPYPRNKETFQAYEHIGIYVYRHDFLMKFVQMPQSKLEVIESLEQLRIIENGFRIKVVETQYPYTGVSVDTQEDLEEVRKIIASNK
ncbi:MAG TPA: 3-deoxy-manno-octulosonate cytidylyltransferase [Brevefilum sp.]|nr:3-deoxy-manno-octulosonate cytidylyltransferase [Brevefilum sp.]